MKSRANSATRMSDSSTQSSHGIKKYHRPPRMSEVKDHERIFIIGLLAHSAGLNIPLEDYQ